ncbi:T9SS-dependent choice-of-anchor J family protein [Chryseobacterium salviniae]|uniref:Choice-of-anchor J domain-containing protein n=1 Tax=Chryseobacterium salviniae TaxID=3101750 RepID=A0ABU6HT09_9FLAO|nr:choice-of-anchor J domain-containing protein [Chryseobacterium sp. T9W2-O]MEC3876181.1 choice-of-anchor J domain-containing protein [Chryseobacterium sp. T9W2-O]
MRTKLLFALLAMPIIANAQFTQNFDAGTTIPAGWTVLNGGDANTWSIVNYTGGTITAYSGANTASIGYSSSAHDDYLVTPAITVTAGVSDFLSFYARSRDPLYPETISVKISTTTPTAAAFTTNLAATVAPPSGANFYKYSYDLSAYVGQTIYIGFHSATTDKFYFDLDDISLGALPACAPPSIVTINSVLPTSANISWTASPTAGATYQIEYGPTGFTQGTGTIITSSTTSAVIPNLSASTGYQFYIRSNCGTNGFSAWSAANSFTTICAPIASFPYTQNFDAATIPSCWANEAVTGGGTATWSYVTANGNSSITPKSAPRMAEFRTTTPGNKAKLLLPVLNISAVASPELRFSLANVNWFGDVDELRIYYKANPSDAWTQIGSSYTTENAAWIDVSIPLPNKSANYTIAFEGTSNWARGVDIDNVSVVDASVLAVNDITKNNTDVKVYPNPVKDVLNINSDKKLNSIQIFSMTGQLIRTIDKDAKQVSVSDLKKGVYLLRVKSEGKDQSFKVVKD